ncbi:hypothetical protein RhiirA5_430274 [Rhizophagus irregularis]|uniref:Uncharacterized protein n=1 Tax=Rhizophagus irregularis TaxID=588596 RepID=A0A2N0NX06_9GLOM|nr:hypothetical protein RhiirA5_430274 [Rhizophagus irregularis]
MNSLTIWHEHGKGTGKDLEKPFICIKKAAENEAQLYALSVVQLHLEILSGDPITEGATKLNIEINLKDESDEEQWTRKFPSPTRRIFKIQLMMI